MRCNEYRILDYSDCQKSMRFGFDMERPVSLKTYHGSLLQPETNKNLPGAIEFRNGGYDAQGQSL